MSSKTLRRSRNWQFAVLIRCIGWPCCLRPSAAPTQSSGASAAGFLAVQFQGPRVHHHHDRPQAPQVV
eukprot:CAMPEP_0172725926 /NCGR_PEP_ID=MMETSP1074-20121228/89554_1 /TAXON_ID=2916 /ORGANISM="Ceratium fusus, Strain PA161109" /LENGTH=67 /DNA_ID=CAMNT_0013552809 /DNA_START=559 /DNA_END=762 /DNA_ORIENTATION=+